MTFEETKTKADSFFEFPTENKDHVTTTSAILFALEAYRSGVEEGRRMQKPKHSRSSADAIVRR